MIKPNTILSGSIFPEAIQVITTIPMGDSTKLIGKGLKTNEPILDSNQTAKLVQPSEKEPFDGDPAKFRLGVEAIRLSLAYEYDTFFFLSTARVDLSAYGGILE